MDLTDTSDVPDPICKACEAHPDGGFTCDPRRPECPVDPIHNYLTGPDAISRSRNAIELLVRLSNLTRREN